VQNTLSNPQADLFYRRRLPHLYVSNHPVFLTWRLKFDLPNIIKHTIKEMKDEFEKRTLELSTEYKLMQGYTYHKRVFDYLDNHLGNSEDLPKLLDNNNMREIISQALLYKHEENYLLHSFCLMPNHIHVLFTPYADKIDLKNTLSKVTHGWKRITAIRINELLGKSGALWASESYDHVVRNEEEFSRIIIYIMQNPVKAGLVKHWKNWGGNWLSDEFIEVMD